MSNNKETEAVQVTIGNLTFTIWCDGRIYDPDLETYRPQYSYSIISDAWRYDANDIQGAPNEIPNLRLAAIALLSIFLTCVQAKDGEENSDLFPEHVKEAGYPIYQQLAEFCSQIT